MDYNRRFILFLVVSFAVLVIYQKLFIPPAPPPEEIAPGVEAPAQPEPSPIADVGKPNIPTAKLEDSSAPTPLPDYGARKAQTIVIDSPLYEATVSTDGGRLVGWRLKSFHETLDENSGLVDLFPFKEPSIRVLEEKLTISGQELLGARAYQYDGPDRIELNEANPTATLELTQTFSGPQGEARIVKTIQLVYDHYDAKMTLASHGLGNIPESSLVWLWSDRVAESNASLFSGRLLMDLPVSFAKNDFEQIQLKELEEPEPYVLTEELGWIGVTREYFFAAAIPLGDQPTTARAKGSVETGDFEWRLEQKVGGGDFSRELMLYMGPRDRALLEKTGHKLVRVFDQMIFSGLTRPLVGPMSFFIKKFHKYAVPNYGVAIILLTLLIKLAVFPLTRKSMMSMRSMRKIQPEMQAIREKLKGDPQKMNAEVMKLYKESGVNPLGGCLPVLIQLPIFIALYTTISLQLDLRHAPFMFWIQDLSKPEQLFEIAGFPIRLLPILMGVSMLVSQRMTPMAGVDPTQQKILNWMPVMFLVISWGFPSGLVLYWIVNNMLQIVQQQVINRTVDRPAIDRSVPTKS